MAQVPSSRQPKYKRILLKLSGEALMGTEDFGIDPKVLDRMALEVGQLTRQPDRGDGRAGRQGQLAIVAAPAQAGRFVTQITQQPLNDAKVVFTRRGQTQPIVVALEERSAEVALQALDLPADGALGQVQFAAGLSEAAMARSRFESAKAGEWREGITRGHAGIRSHGITAPEHNTGGSGTGLRGAFHRQIAVRGISRVQDFSLTSVSPSWAICSALR